MAVKSHSTDSGADSKEVFDHALYHHLAHWAAYTAMVGLLVTIGVGLSLTPIISDAARGVRALVSAWRSFARSWVLATSPRAWTLTAQLSMNGFQKRT